MELNLNLRDWTTHRYYTRTHRGTGNTAADLGSHLTFSYSEIDYLHSVAQHYKFHYPRFDLVELRASESFPLLDFD